jgi:hypothetical protein
MESVRLWSGYRLPPGMAMADVRRFHEELLASEGLDLLPDLDTEESDEDEHDEAAAKHELHQS